MIVQEHKGVAVGWPLNLGHDTTGWPLGLRLRLLHEDLQWPRMPELAHSSSGRSTDSSSLDTMSTRSFFKDNSKSLGALIGLPMLDRAGNPVRVRNQQQQPQRRVAFRGPSTVRPNTPASSPVLGNANNILKTRAKARRHQHGRRSAKQQQQHLSASSTAQGTSSIASSAGWSLLSALSCARVPAEIGADENEGEETSIPCVQLVAREVPSRSSVRNPEVELQENRGTTVRPLNSSQQHLNSLAKKFYDNITFEDEELEMCNKHRRSTNELSSDGSPEWNPLFASSPQAARDEEKNELDDDDETSRRTAGTMTTMCDQFLVQRASCTAAVPLMTILGTSNKDADALLYRRKGNARLRSMTFCVDVGKWQQTQKQLGQWRAQLMNTTTAHDDKQFISHPAQESFKSKVVAAFIYRMRLNRRMRTSQIDGAWLNTCIGPFARCRMLWGSIFRQDTAAVLGGPNASSSTY